MSPCIEGIINYGLLQFQKDSSNLNPYLIVELYIFVKCENHGTYRTLGFLLQLYQPRLEPVINLEFDCSTS